MTGAETAAPGRPTPGEQTNTEPMDVPDASGVVGTPAEDVPPQRPTDTDCMGKRTERRDGVSVFVGCCKNAPGKGTDHVGTGRCKFHGGASTGPRDTSYLEGNEYAVGNSGGGAPELNTNAEIHGVFNDLEKVEARLSGADREFVDEVAASYVEEADPDAEDVEEKAREVALLFLKEIWAQNDFGARGPAWEDEWTEETHRGTVTVHGLRANPTFAAMTRLSKRQRDLLTEIGVFPV